MNAPNSITQDKRVSERKAYEPSMEEILASIRRIIADDQALATRRAAAPKEKPQPVDPPAALPGVNIPPLASSPKPATDGGNGSGFMVDTQRARAEPKLQSAYSSAPAVERVTPSSEKIAPQRNESPAQKPAPEAEIQEFASSPCNMAEAMADDLRRGHDDFEDLDSNKEPESEAMAASEAQRSITKPPMPARGAGTAADQLVSPATDTSVSAAFNTLVASRFLQSSDALSDVIREMIRPMLKTWLDENLPGMVERLVRAEIERVTRGGR